jgi:arsenate reductase (thioredoxin)
MPEILFVCLHGGAKSVIAAEYFNRIASEEALPFTAVATAAEDAYDAVPTPVADYLQRDGLDVRAFRPRRVTPQDIDAASKVVTIGCALPLPAERWDDVPQASEDLDGAVAAIRRHVEELAEELRGRA